MNGFPFTNGWGPGRVPFPPRFRNAEPNFVPNLQAPPPNFHPAYRVPYPPPMPRMGFPSAMPIPPPRTSFERPPQMILEPLNRFSHPVLPVQVDHYCEKERNLCAFLGSRKISKNKSARNGVSIVEFRSTLKNALGLLKVLKNFKKDMSLKAEGHEKQWETEMDKARALKKELNALCCFVSSPKNLSALKDRIKVQAKRRASKVQKKKELALQKAREQESLHRKIDRWLEEVKEKNLKLKRDEEMKREADNVLSEVRRKIQEAKRVEEFLKVLAKLRTVRQAHAFEIGLEISEDHTVKFANTLGSIRSCFTNQLEQYEGEERALKVMLEAEQEERREEEAKRQVEAALKLLHLKQESCLEALFGCTESDEPVAGAPLFFFHQYHNSSNWSMDSLVQIRRQWDAYISEEEGDSVPQQWVVPLPPSSAIWERFCESLQGKS